MGVFPQGRNGALAPTLAPGRRDMAQLVLDESLPRGTFVPAPIGEKRFGRCKTRDSTAVHQPGLVHSQIFHRILLQNMV